MCPTGKITNQESFKPSRSIKQQQQKVPAIKNTFYVVMKGTR